MDGFPVPFAQRIAQPVKSKKYLYLNPLLQGKLASPVVEASGFARSCLFNCLTFLLARARIVTPALD